MLLNFNEREIVAAVTCPAGVPSATNASFILDVPLLSTACPFDDLVCNRRGALAEVSDVVGTSLAVSLFVSEKSLPYIFT